MTDGSDGARDIASLPFAGPPRRALKTIKVRARGEDYRVVQVSGNLFVCANGCCCGHSDKGRLPVPVERFEQEWDTRRIRNQVHLTFTGCLGPCVAGNNAMLQIHGRSIWFHDLNDESLVSPLFDYIEAMLVAGRPILPPDSLVGHVNERYLAPPEGSFTQSFMSADDDDGGLDRLDPVCLMDVDPSTARHKSEFQGRTYYFCAPSCRRAFDRDPASYIMA